jgi:protein involved in polysaccharide export with SLBB domain
MKTFKQSLSLFLIILILLPSTQGWCQEGSASQGTGSDSSMGMGSGGLGGGGGEGLGSGTAGTGQTPATGLGVPPTAPSTQGISPNLKSQAEFYLQKIGGTPSTLSPQQLEPGKLAPSLMPSQAATPQAQTSQEEAGKLAPGATGQQVEELTAIEIRSRAQGMPLRYFGYDLFRQPPSSFLPVTAVPVGPDYVIGPGDTIHLIIWGSVQGEYSQTVDRNGQIALPKIGVVHVSGLTFRQLQEVMEREFARQYNNFQMNVTLDNLRTIRVYVVGQAAHPGSYSISSLSTLINALFAAGGPSTSGSMRDIQVRRQGRVIVHFDLYDFLIRGNKSKDIRLMPEDVIFIPLAGKHAGIGGPVKQPAIYELKGERTLVDLINLAGGLAASAFKSRVQLLRIKDRREMVLIEDDLEKFLSGRLPDIVLEDGDLIKVFPVPSVDIKMVRVQGVVQNPGEFGYRDNMRIKDLITFAGGFLLQSNLEEAELTRVTVTPEGPVTTRLYINLRRAMAGNPRDNILLKPNDYLFVRAVPDWSLYHLVSVGGEVKYPGTYTIKKGETLSSVLLRAGGFTDRAYTKGAFFTREAVKKMQAEQLKQAINRMEAEMLATSTEQIQTSLDKDEVAQQKLIMAQQQKFLASMRTIVPLGRVVIHIDDPERLRGTPDDLELQDGDSLIVPQVQQTVNVLGSVVNPTAVVYDRYLTVKDYLAQVGGPTKGADVSHMYIIKVNGSALSGQGGFLFGRRVASARLDPGDTIVVPENFERIPWLKTIKDVATIIGNIALTAGVVLVGLK